MVSRLTLHKTFEEILGSKNVYFQPPPTYKMRYPAIRYKRKRINNVSADNSKYHQSTSYEVIVIDKDPDSKFVEAVSRLPYCVHDRTYVADNLNHDVFTLTI